MTEVEQLVKVMEECDKRSATCERWILAVNPHAGFALVAPNSVMLAFQGMPGYICDIWMN